MKFSRRLLKVAILSSVFIATVPFGQVAAEAEANCFSYKAEEKGFFNKLNIARKAGGRTELKLDRELSRVARKQTATMVEKNLLHHTPDAKMRRRVTNWQLLGENVGVGGSVTSLDTAFMNSPDHRANIMESDFRNVGIGTRYANGRLWVTVIFEAETNPGTTLRMPSC